MQEDHLRETTEMLRAKMSHIKELQYLLDEKELREVDWEEQKAVFRQRVDEQKACIWEKIKAKIKAEFQMRTMRIKIRDLQTKEPCEDEHFPNLCEVLPPLKIHNLEYLDQQESDDDSERSGQS